MNKHETFIIPAPGNSITERDVSKRQIRITKDFKKYFPKNNSKLNVIIDGISYPTSFYYKEERSHVWRLDKEIVNKLQLQSGSQVLIRKYDHTNYELKINGVD